MKAVDSELKSNVLEFRDVALNSGQARFYLPLAAGDLALFEVEENVRLGWLGDLALGLIEPVAGEVCFQGGTWGKMLPEESERRRRTVGRVWVPEEGAAFLQNLDLDENIQLAQRFDPRQRSGEVGERAFRMARRFGLDDLPKMRPAHAKRRTLQMAQWVRAFLPKELNLLILDAPLRGVADGDASVLIKSVVEAREQGVAVLWVERAGSSLKDSGLEPDWHFPVIPPSLRAEA